MNRSAPRISGSDETLVARGGISRFLRKLADGEPVTVVYFGTSVTTGEWPNPVTRRLQERFPRSPIRAVNRSIGGSASDLGVFRVGRDVIAHEPDLVFVEFINDFNAGGDPAVAFQMDGIVQQLRRARPECDIVIVHVPRETYTEAYGRSAVPPHVVQHESVAERHGVPSIHAGLAVARRIAAGTLTWPAFAGDTVHPNEAGHRLLADMVSECLERLETVRGGMRPCPPALCEWYARARLVDISAAELLTADPERARTAWVRRLEAGELTRDWPEREDYYRRDLHDRMPRVWTLSRPGDALHREFEGTAVGLYDLHGPDTGSVAVRVDGREVGVFDRFIAAGRTIYRLSNGVLFTSGLPFGRHRVEVTLLDRASPTGLVPVILAGFWLEG